MCPISKFLCKENLVTPTVAILIGLTVSVVISLSVLATLTFSYSVSASTLNAIYSLNNTKSSLSAEVSEILVKKYKIPQELKPLIVLESKNVLLSDNKVYSTDSQAAIARIASLVVSNTDFGESQAATFEELYTFFEIAYSAQDALSFEKNNQLKLYEDQRNSLATGAIIRFLLPPAN